MVRSSRRAAFRSPGALPRGVHGGDELRSACAFAFRCFFALLFKGIVPADIVEVVAPSASRGGAAAGRDRGDRSARSRRRQRTIRVTARFNCSPCFQRDGRLIDFLLEDIAGYSDAQIGAAVRDVHASCRRGVDRYCRRADSRRLEGQTIALGAPVDPSTVRLVGNVGQRRAPRHRPRPRLARRPAGPAAAGRLGGAAGRDAGRGGDRLTWTRRFIIGIDLGTTNCALADVDTSAGDDARPAVQAHRAARRSGRGRAARTLLPSFLYLPRPARFPGRGARVAVGRRRPTARDRRARAQPRRREPAAPGRVGQVVALARGRRPDAPRSCRGRRPTDVPKRLAASTRRRAYLEHLRSAWDARAAADDARCADTTVLLTVPGLVRRGGARADAPAAAAAGLAERHAARRAAGRVLRVDRQRRATRWREQRQGRRPGAGVRRRRRHDRLQPDRGRRGATATSRSSASPSAITSCSAATTWIWRWRAVAAAAPRGRGPPHRRLAAPARSGTSAGSPRRRCSREPDAQGAARHGARPGQPADRRHDQDRARPRRSGRRCWSTASSRRSAPTSVPAATRRRRPAGARAALRRRCRGHEAPGARSWPGRRRRRRAGHPRCAAARAAWPCPTHVLFNGGVMKAEPLRARVVEVLERWLAAGRVRAARRGHVLDGAGPRPRGRARRRLLRPARAADAACASAAAPPRTYYIGVESALPAVPGVSRRRSRRCASCRSAWRKGTERRRSPAASSASWSASRRSSASSARRSARTTAPAPLIEDWGDELEELGPLEVTLTAPRTRADAVVPVRLESRVTEIGTLELWCVARDGAHRWKLELNIRQRDAARR